MSKANAVHACYKSANVCIHIAYDALAQSDYAMAEIQLHYALANARGTEHRLLRAHIVQALELTQKARTGYVRA